ncbi:MAG TPA: hypothetical protein P5120_08925 [Spirochaetota bacterium]|nr:hypothetical protein [Spirochaetota bacterium]
MIYLAVLLVLTGLLIVLVALFSESGRAHLSDRADFTESFSSASDISGGLNPEDIDIIIPERVKKAAPQSPAVRPDEEDIFISFDKRDDSGKEYASARGGIQEDRLDEWGIDDPDRDEIIPDSGPLEESSGSVFSELEEDLAADNEPDSFSSADSGVYAVLFDDKSNLIDYDSGVTGIEPSVSALKSIKRIGRGKVQVDDGGVSFYIGDKFYRFDFHKLYDVWSGPGFVALPLKGGSSVKLFMIDGAPDFPDRVEVYYQEYIKGI